MSGFACLGSDSDDESKAAPVFNFGAATLGAAPALAGDTLEPVTAISAGFGDLSAALGGIEARVANPSADKKTWDFGSFRDNINHALTEGKKETSAVLASLIASEAADDEGAGGGATLEGGTGGGKKLTGSRKANARKKKLLARGGGYADRHKGRVAAKGRKGKQRRQARNGY